MAVIKRVDIRGYRTLRELSWQPRAGVNVLLGAGDSGKSTLLSALSLFQDRRQLSEFDYYRRHTADGFDVTAVISGLDSAQLAAERTPLPIRGWLNDALTPLPENGAEEVLVFRASGTPELELTYSLIAESGDSFPLTTMRLMRQLHVLFVSRSDETAREFRGTTRSLLSRNFTEANFGQAARAALQHAVANWIDPAEAEKDLEEIRGVFQEYGLPHKLLLGIMPPSGAAASQAVTAFSGTDPQESIPYELAGGGTRQLATLVLASRLIDNPPILLVDELEAGLEPHRQRVAAKLVQRATKSGGQAFVATHAPAVVSALAKVHHWQMASDAILEIPERLSSSVFKANPEAAFAKLSIVCEGETEQGLVEPLWSHYSGRDIEESGVALIDGGGHQNALSMLQNLIDAHLPCAGFVDNEVERSGTRATLKAMIPLFSWEPLQMPEEALAKWLPRELLGSLLKTIADARTRLVKRYDVRIIVSEVERRLNLEPSRDIDTIIQASGEEAVRDAIYKALSENSAMKPRLVAKAVGEWLVNVGLPDEIDKRAKAFFEQCLPLL